MSETQNDKAEVQENRKRYLTPHLQLLGPVKQLTLGGSNGAREDGSQDENESRP